MLRYTILLLAALASARLVAQEQATKATVLPPSPAGAGGVLELEMDALPVAPGTIIGSAPKEVSVGAPVAGGQERPAPIEITLSAVPVVDVTTSTVQKTIAGGTGNTGQGASIIEMEIGARPLFPRERPLIAEPR
jgi:hypothetical protein